MVKIPKRNLLAQIYRKPAYKVERFIPLLSKNPGLYQFLALILSILFLFTQNQPFYQLILITLILLLDWFDGATARKQGITSKKGYITDVAVDRISEGLIFFTIINSNIGKFFFTLYLVNNILSFHSIKSGKHRIIALRFFYLLFLIVNYL